jgi:hypothetical protein
MKPTEPIERLLERTPVPSLSEGPHRDRLRNQLLEQSTISYPRKTKMSILNRISPVVKIALAVFTAILLIGTGWAAEKIYEKLVTIKVMTSEPKEVTMPDGSKGYSVTAAATEVDSNDPKAVEDANRLLRDSLAAEEKRQETIQKAINLGRFRLLDVGSQVAHECQDVGSDRVFQVSHCTLDVYEDVAYVVDVDTKASGEKGTAQTVTGTVQTAVVTTGSKDKKRPMTLKVNAQSGKMHDASAQASGDGAMSVVVTDTPGAAPATTSWKDHLRLIREGKRQLLHATVQTVYVYEVTLDDGSKVSYSCPFELRLPKVKAG